MTLAEPSGRSSAHLLRFWDETRLRSADAKSSSRKPARGTTASWRDAMADVLDVGYGVHARYRWANGRWERAYRRTTPSAGALYPFEALLVVVDDGVYLWQAGDGRADGPARLHRLATPAPSREDLVAADLAAPEDGPPVRALLLLSARPWRSTRKYRRRGYAYCHLDVGHTAVNLALYAGALGLAPTVHLRFDRQAVTRALDLEGRCRDPIAALVFRSAEDSPARAPEVEAGATLPPPGERERRGWEALRGLLAVDAVIEPAEPPAAVAPLAEPEEPGDGGTDVPLPLGRPGPATSREWRAASLVRRSAKGFLDRPLGIEQLGEILAAARGAAVATDAGDEAPILLGARLLARRVDGAEGVFAYSAADHSLRPIAPTAGDPGPACMHQEIAGQAAAMLVLHAPLGRWIEERGWSAFAELHFRAAEIAQRLYLAAARIEPVGLTCIGGFDADECSTLVALPVDEEPVYVLLLGVRDEDAVKHDRLDVAYSHGHLSSEGSELP